MASAEEKPPAEVTEDLTNDGSLIKTILREGEGDEAGRGAKVALKYSLSLSEDSEPFDSSETRRNGTLEFSLGKKKVIPALELLAQSMKLKEKCKAKAAAPYAFGGKGLRRKGVPPNSPIFMEVEMIRLEGGEKKKALADMTPTERFEQAKECKEAGNTFFKELKYEKALTQYSQCIRYLSNVFYKPNIAPKESVASPIGEQTDDAKENSISQTGNKDISQDDKNVSQDDKDLSQDVERSVEQGEDAEVSSEEGFDEAKIIDIPPAVVELPPEEGDNEVIETLDVSTGGEAREEIKSVANESEERSNMPNGTSNEDVNEVESKAEQPEDTTAEEAELEDDDPEEVEVRSLHVTALNNLSLCLVKLEDYKQAVESATYALKMDTDSSKALYYR